MNTDEVDAILSSRIIDFYEISLNSRMNLGRSNKQMSLYPESAEINCFCYEAVMISLTLQNGIT